MGLRLQDLTPGTSFQTSDFVLDGALVTKYLAAVGDANPLYAEAAGKTGYVPPSAIAALAMRTLIQALELPPGAIHTSQEFAFRKPLKSDSRVSCRAIVLQMQTRGAMRILSMETQAQDSSGDTVLTGKTTVMLPG